MPLYVLKIACRIVWTYHCYGHEIMMIRPEQGCRPFIRAWPRWLSTVTQIQHLFNVIFTRRKLQRAPAKAKWWATLENVAFVECVPSGVNRLYSPICLSDSTTIRAIVPHFCECIVTDGLIKRSMLVTQNCIHLHRVNILSIRKVWDLAWWCMVKGADVLISNKYENMLHIGFAIFNPFSVV